MQASFASVANAAVTCGCSGDGSGINKFSADTAQGCYDTANATYTSWSCTVYSADESRYIDSRTGPSTSASPSGSETTNTTGTAAGTADTSSPGYTGGTPASAPSSGGAPDGSAAGNTSNDFGSDTGTTGSSASNISYTLLEPLPGKFPTAVGDSSAFYEYLNGLLMVLIIVGAMLAVVRFTIGGVTYMMSDVPGVRVNAKSQMWASQMWACLWGLLLLVSSVLILKTVNPNLVKFTLFEDISKQVTGNK
jgi:hypothetical protein